MSGISVSTSRLQWANSGSASALSKQSPIRPIDCPKPCLEGTAREASEVYWHPGSECTSSPAAQTATKRYELQRIDFSRSSQAQQPLRSLFSRQHIRTKRDRPGSPSSVRTRPETRRSPLGEPSRRLLRKGQVPLQHPNPTGEPQFLPVVLRTSARLNQVQDIGTVAARTSSLFRLTTISANPSVSSRVSKTRGQGQSVLFWN